MRRRELCASLPERARRGDRQNLQAALGVSQPPAARGELDLERLGGAGGDRVPGAAQLDGDPEPGELDALSAAQRERAGAVAGRGRRAAHRDPRRATLDLHRAAPDGHRPRRGVDRRRRDDRRRRGIGRAVDRLEAVEDVELPGIGDDRVVAGAAAGQVGRAVADVNPVVALVSGDDVEAAAGGDGVVARPAEERLGRPAAGQRVVARAA